MPHYRPCAGGLPRFPSSSRPNRAVEATACPSKVATFQHPCYTAGYAATQFSSSPPPPPPRPRDVLEGRWLDRRLQEAAKAVGGGYCRLQMPLSLALGVRETVAGRPAGGSGYLPPFQSPPPPPWSLAPKVCSTFPAVTVQVYWTGSGFFEGQRHLAYHTLRA